MENVRFTLTVPAEISRKVDDLKQKYFYNKSYAALYRRLIQLGMDELKKMKQ